MQVNLARMQRTDPSGGYVTRASTSFAIDIDDAPQAARGADGEGNRDGASPASKHANVKVASGKGELFGAAAPIDTGRPPCFRRWVSFMRSTVVGVVYDQEPHARIGKENSRGQYVGVAEQMNEHHGKEMRMFGTRMTVAGPEGSHHIGKRAELVKIDGRGARMMYTLCLDGGESVEDTTAADGILVVAARDARIHFEELESEDNPWTLSGGSGEYFMHETKFRFSHRACFCMTTDFIPRNVIVWIVTSRLFGRLVLVLILLNTAIIGMTQYDVVDEDLLPAIEGRSTIPPYGKVYSWRNAMNLYSENVFTGIFTVEMLLKMIAMGVIVHKGAYLRDMWNWLDFIVVLSGLVTAAGLPGVSAFRSFRVLRPLKTLTAIRKIRLIVVALLKSTEELLNLVIVLFFIFVVFGIFGLQSFAGNTNFRCRLTEFPVAVSAADAALYNNEADRINAFGLDPMSESFFRSNDSFTQFPITYGILFPNRLAARNISSAKFYSPCALPGDSNPIPLHVDTWLVKEDSLWSTPRNCIWPLDPMIDRTCNDETSARFAFGQTVYTCPSIGATKRTCGSNFDNFGSARFVDETHMVSPVWDETRNWGYTTFDSIVPAFTTIFQCITLEGWTQIMYVNMDVNGDITTAAVFFSLVLIGSFFLLNLTIAILGSKFDEVTDDERALQARTSKEAEQIALRTIFRRLDVDGDGVVEPDEIRVILPPEMNEDEIQAFFAKVDDDGSGSIEFEELEDALLELEEHKRNKEKDHPGHFNKLVAWLARWWGQPIDEPWLPKVKVCQVAYKVVNGNVFSGIIVICILLNTVTLSLDMYPERPELALVLDIINFVLSSIFTLELVIKLPVLGFRQYAHDLFNIFDAFVVIASLADVIVAPPRFLGFGEPAASAGGAVTAVRTVRIFRLFKLAKSWQTLQDLLVSMVNSMKSAMYFMVLMMLFTFIYALVGMQIFSNALYFDALTNKAVSLSDVIVMYEAHESSADAGDLYKPDWYRPRTNFDSLGHSLFAVIQVLSGEDWNKVMYGCIRAKGDIARGYFISLIALGSMVLLDFFLAILLSDFEDAAAGVDETEENLDSALVLIAGTNDPGAFGLSDAAFAALLDARGSSSALCAAGETGDDAAMEAYAVVVQTAAGVHHEVELTQMQKWNHKLSEVYRVVCREEHTKNDAAGLDLADVDDFDPDDEPVGAAADDSIGPLTHFPNRRYVPEDATAEMLSHWKGSGDDDDDDEVEGAIVTKTFIEHLQAVGTKLKKDESVWMWRNELQDEHSLDTARGPIAAYKIGRFIQKWTEEDIPHLRVREVTEVENEYGRMCYAHTEWELFNESRLNARFEQAEEPEEVPCKEKCTARMNTLCCEYEELPTLPARSLCLFRNDFKPREWAAKLVLSKRFEPFTFDNVVLVLIIFSSIALAIETPLDDPNSDFAFGMKIFGLIINIIFTFEMVVKISVHGLVLHHGAYLSDAWNQLDVAIVIISWLTFIMADVSEFKTLRTLRLLRVLRAVRTINRFPGLKLVVEALFRSIPPLLNLVPVIALFFLIFAIFAVNSLKGCLNACYGPTYDSFTDAQQALIFTPRPWSSLTTDQQLLWPLYGGSLNTTAPYIYNMSAVRTQAALSPTPGYVGEAGLGGGLTSKSICLWLGGDWNKVVPQSFDNVLEAMVSFLELSTTEGWVDVAYAAVDSQGLDMQPKFENEGSMNEYMWLSFFSVFIAFGGFFLVNMFIGVMIQTFKRMKNEKGGGAVLLTESQTQWAKTKKALQRLQPNEKHSEPVRCRKCRILCYWVTERDVNIPLEKVDIRRLTCMRTLLHNKHHDLKPLFISFNFDSFIMLCIILNTVAMAAYFFGQPGWYSAAIGIANYIFAGIFTIEAVLKLIALGFPAYWQNSWNRFDLIVVVATIAAISSSLMFSLSISGLAMIVRTFRLARLIRLLNKAKTLRMIFNALVLSAPSLLNVGALVFLVFFIFTVISVQLFAKVGFPEGGGELNEHVNFVNFPTALLTLLRSSTGEAWPNLLYELGATPPGCSADRDFDERYCGFSTPVFKEGCIPLDGCGTYMSIPFWMAFILVVSAVMLNLIVFYVLDSFEQTKSDEEKHLNFEQEQELLAVWSQFSESDGRTISQANLTKFVSTLHKPLGFAPNPQSPDVRHHTITSPEQRDSQLAAMNIQGHNVNGTTMFNLVRVAVAIGKRTAADMEDLDDVEEIELPEEHPDAGVSNLFLNNDGVKTKDLEEDFELKTIIRLYRVYRARRAIVDAVSSINRGTGPEESSRQLREQAPAMVPMEDAQPMFLYNDGTTIRTDASNSYQASRPAPLSEMPPPMASPMRRPTIVSPLHAQFTDALNFGEDDMPSAIPARMMMEKVEDESSDLELSDGSI